MGNGQRSLVSTVTVAITVSVTVSVAVSVAGTVAPGAMGGGGDSRQVRSLGGGDLRSVS